MIIGNSDDVTPKVQDLADSDFENLRAGMEEVLADFYEGHHFPGLDIFIDSMIAEGAQHIDHMVTAHNVLPENAAHEEWSDSLEAMFLLGRIIERRNFQFRLECKCREEKAKASKEN